jgi:hypothetical protein
LCREQVSQLRPKVSEIRAKGAELIAIGNGSTQHAAWFVDDQHLDFPVFTDPSLSAYRAAGFERSVLGIVTPLAIKGGFRAWREGFRQASVVPKGDALQLGGVIVVRSDGEVLWRFSSRAAGDHPTPEEVVAQVA